MSTPIEIVRAQVKWWHEASDYSTPPSTAEEYFAALASVLADAERFQTAKQDIAKLLEKGGRLSNTVQICCQVSTFKPQREVLKAVLKDWDQVVAELADRLREGWR